MIFRPSLVWMPEEEKIQDFVAPRGFFLNYAHSLFLLNYI